MAEVKWPKFIKVGGHRFLLNLRAGSNPLGDCLWGCMDPKANEISVAADVAPSRVVEVVLHEVLHAALAPLKTDRETEEEMVHCLGEGLTQVFRDNPKLIQACLEALSD